MRTLVGLCTAALLLVGCGGSSEDDPAADAGQDHGADAGDVEDTTAPEILSVSPADNATGVRDDATVVFEFSEPMDQLSVQNSIDTSDLGGVSFAWSNGGATLTITPDEPLAYAEGTGNNPGDTNALRYTVVIGTGATDEAGNHVDIGAQTTFSTLKAISTSFGRDNALTGAGTPAGVTTDADDFLYVGDDALGGASNGYRGYITIDMGLLPTTAVEIASATLSGYQLAEIGSPYPALGAGSGVILDHSVFTLGDEAADNAAFNMMPLSQVGVLANAGDTALEIDVTSQAQDDLEHRNERDSLSQYRLRFTEFTNLDGTADYVLIGRDELTLDVVYLAP